MSTNDISYVKGDCVNTKLCKIKQWTPKYFWSCQAARIFLAWQWECGGEDNDGEFESPAAHSYFLDGLFQIFHLGEITSKHTFIFWHGWNINLIVTPKNMWVAKNVAFYDKLHTSWFTQYGTGRVCINKFVWFHIMCVKLNFL